MPPPAPDRLRAAAWLNIVVHVFGLALAATALRPGTGLVDLPERSAYLAGSPLGWTLGWATWIACAAALVWFVALLSERLDDRIAPSLVIAGAAVDLLCDALWITVVPELARRGAAGEALFLTVERIAGIGGAVVANGLYTVAALLLTLRLRGRPGFSVPLGAGVVVSGSGMVVAGFTGDPLHLAIATGPTIGFYCLWTLAAARAAPSPGSSGT